jgi:hypothetical protein
MRVAGLTAFYTYVQIDRHDDAVQESESPTEYRLSLSLSRPQRQRFSHGVFEQLRPDFETALTVVVGVAGAPLLSLEPGAWPADLDAMVDTIRLSDGELPFSLHVDKRRLIELLPSPGSECILRYYLFADRLVRVLTGRLEDVEAVLFPEFGRSTLVIISDSSVHLAGPVLTIVDEGTYVTLPRPVCAALPAPVRSRMDEYRRTRLDDVGQLNWSGLELQSLTPLHLRVDSVSIGNAEIEHALLQKQWLLAILYTATQCTYANDRLIAYYIAGERAARVSIDIPDPAPDDRSRVAWLGSWPYEGDRGSGDRLAIVRNVCARDLDLPSGEENARRLASRLQYIEEQAEWHLGVYVSSQIDAQFAHLQAAAEYATESARKIGDSVDSLSKGLTETALASVAAVFAAVATPLLKNDFPPFIVGVLLVAYALYLYAFQMNYRLSAIKASARILRDETDARLDAFERDLGKVRVDPLRTQVTNRWTYFQMWSDRTYDWTGLLALLLLLLALLWPITLASGGLLGSQAPRTATLVPSQVVPGVNPEQSPATSPTITR